MHLTPTQRHVLLHLKATATHSETQQSFDDIAEATGFNRRTIIRAINALEDAGVIQRIHQRHEDDGDAANLYRINP